MQARGPLMIEHRLIERMISMIESVLITIEAEHEVDADCVDTVVDFIRTYADRTHHGKEEDILFRQLNNKAMGEKDRRIMKELIEEHALGRRTNQALYEANLRYREGDDTALSEISSRLRIFTEFYPNHIEKEDKVFFPSSRQYFSDEEDQTMVKEFWEFDRKMIHEKYRAVIEGLERQK